MLMREKETHVADVEQEAGMLKSLAYNTRDNRGNGNMAMLINAARMPDMSTRLTFKGSLIHSFVLIKTRFG